MPLARCASLSRALRPAVAQGGTGTRKTTLVVVADAYDDQPVNHHYAETFTPRADRHRIWLKARRQVGAAYQDTASNNLIALDGLLASHELSKLSRELPVAELDDNNPAAMANPPGMVPLPMRMYLNPIGEWFGFDALNPAGTSARDATFGGLGITGPPANLVPLFGPCAWPAYDTVGLGAPHTDHFDFCEREAMVRSEITNRLRYGEAGVSGKVAVAYIGSRDDGSGAHDDFLLTFHRTVRKGLNPNEPHYGVGEQARNTIGVPPGSTLPWSANYVDRHRNDPVMGEALKLEIVTIRVTCTVPTSGSVLSVTAQAPEILETWGDHTDKVATPGAEAVDPVLVANSSGDVVITYRSRQDPYFEFAAPTTTSTLSSGTIGLGVPAVPGCGGNYLPYPFLSVPTVDWAAFHRDSHWRVYDWRQRGRFRAAGLSSAWSAEFELSEPLYPVGATEPGFRQEDRVSVAPNPSWTQDLHDIEQRDGLLRLFEQYPVLLAFHRNWDATNYHVQVDTVDPHSHHHSLDAKVVVGERPVSGTQLNVVASSKTA